MSARRCPCGFRPCTRCHSGRTNGHALDHSRLREFRPPRASGDARRAARAIETAFDRARQAQSTSEMINALPEVVRSFIHDLEARADPAGDVAARVVSQENCGALQVLLGERDEEIAELRRRVHQLEAR